MLHTQPNSEIQARIRTLQVIAGALIMGVVIFAVIAAVIGGQNPILPPSGGGGPAGGGPVNLSTIDLLRIVAGVTLLGCIAAIVVSNRAIKRAAMQERSNAGTHTSQQQIQLLLIRKFYIGSILTLALLEGPALFGGVIVLMSGNPIDLVFVAIPALGMIVMFPTMGKWERFSQSQGVGELEPFTNR